MRLFIAIPLSTEMQKALVACMHDLKKQGVEGNYVPAANLHMTLAFIGEYDDPKKVRQVLEKVPLPGFRLTLSEKGNFGNLLWAGVKGNQKLSAYVKELRAALKEEGIPFETGLWTNAVFLQLRNGRHSLYSGYADYADLYHRMPYRRL